MEKWKKILNRETILYIVFGGATTLVNFLVFYLCYYIAFDRAHSLTANCLAFAAAVVFAFVVNKIYVFESKSWSADVLRREIPSFLGARIGSFLVEEAGLWLCVRLNLEQVVLVQMAGITVDGIAAAKVALSVIVVILNYIFCKWFVFKK